MWSSSEFLTASRADSQRPKARKGRPADGLRLILRPSCPTIRTAVNSDAELAFMDHAAAR